MSSSTKDQQKKKPGSDVDTILSYIKGNKTRTLKKNLRLDYAEFDKGVNLEGVNLIGSHLNHAILDEAKLKGVNLNGAQLSRAHLNGANLFKARLNKAILKAADLKGANLGKADLNEAHLKFAHLNDAKLNGARLKKARLDYAQLPNAQLIKVVLKDANLTGANLTNAQLNGANLKGAIFDKAIIEGCNFSDSKFLPYNPPKSKSSKTIGTWRMRAVTKATMTGFFQLWLQGADDDEDDDDEDEDESGEEDNNDDDIPNSSNPRDDDDDDNADNSNEDNNNPEQNLSNNDNVDTTNEYVKKGVEKTINTFKPVLHAVDLSLKMTSHALEKIFENFESMHNEEFQSRIASIMILLVEELVIGFMKSILQKDKTLILDLNDNARKALAKFKTRLQRKTKITLQIDGIIEGLHERGNHANDEENQVEDDDNQVEGEMADSMKTLLKDLIDIILKATKDSLTKEIDDVLKSSFDDNDIERALSQLEKVRQLHKKLEQLLSSGIDLAASKLLMKYCNKRIATFAKIMDKQIEVAEMFESSLVEKSKDAQNLMNKKFKTFFPKGSIKRNIVKSILKTASKYDIKLSDNETNVSTIFGAIKFSRIELNTDEAELNYILDKLVKIEEMDVTKEKWKDAAQSWMSLMNIRSQMKSRKISAVITCIASDKGVMEALSMAKALQYTLGGCDSIVAKLSNEPGRHIRQYGYRYQRTIRQEIARINKIRYQQTLILSFIGTTFASVMFALFNYLFQRVSSSTTWWHLLLIVIGVILFGGIILSISYFYCRRSLNGKRQIEEREKLLQ